jgi:nitrate reductase NapAB chaperone NapD
MSIISYLAIPMNGQISQLKKNLLKINGCEIIESETNDMLIVLTDTNNDTDDQLLYEQIRQLPEIQSLKMVFGHNNIEVQEGA